MNVKYKFIVQVRRLQTLAGKFQYSGFVIYLF